MTTPTNKPRSVRRWLDRLVRLWQLHLFFVVESRAYIGRYTWRDRLQWPLAWWYFMRASVRDMRSPNAAVSDGSQPFAPRPGSARYCDDPDNCTYSDCPTAFCDRNFANGTESQRPGAAGAQMQTCVRDVGIRHDLKSPNSGMNDSDRS